MKPGAHLSRMRGGHVLLLLAALLATLVHATPAGEGQNDLQKGRKVTGVDAKRWDTPSLLRLKRCRQCRCTNLKNVTSIPRYCKDCCEIKNKHFIKSSPLEKPSTRVKRSATDGWFQTQWGNLKRTLASWRDKIRDTFRSKK